MSSWLTREYFQEIVAARVFFSCWDDKGCWFGDRQNDQTLRNCSKTINAKPELALGITLPKESMVIGAAGVGVIEPAHALIALMSQVP